jgi:hypothetical protein
MNETPPTVVPPAQAKICPLAIWSLVLGILSLLCFSIFTGLPAVICGHTAASRIKRSAGAMSGQGLALAGVITGYVSIALIPIIALVVAIAIPNIVKLRATACHNVRINTLPQIESVIHQAARITVTANGVTYELPQQSGNSVTIVNSNLIYKTDTLSVEVSDGVITVNGQKYGNVVSGDTIQINSSGEVNINGKAMTAQ